MRQVKITYMPQKVEQWVVSGTTIQEAAVAAGVEVEALCGGRGTCGKCLVRCSGVPTEPSPAEQEKIRPELLASGWRLACRTVVAEDMVVEIPDQGAGQLIKGNLSVATGVLAGSGEGQSALVKIHLKTSPSSLEDPRADWDRVQALLPQSQSQVDLKILRELPVLVRQNADLTAVLYRGEILALEAGDTTAKAYGCAVDIGTTTVVVSLHDLRTGEVLSVTSAFNPQRAYGGDVLARIDFSLHGQNLEKLQDLIVEAVNVLIEQASAQAGIDTKSIYLVSVVGNTTMQHLFLGLSPRHIAVPPFVGVLYAGLDFAARDLGLRIHDGGRVTLLPHVAGYVGADIVAGVLATGLYREERPTLLIDVGTNAEIVLAANGTLYACSAAAGPAFEGANISCGMRAGTGAVDRVWLEADDLHYSVIGSSEPQGICGSGLIDVVGELLQAGVIDGTGRLLSREEAKPLVGLTLAGRLYEGENGEEFLLADRGPLHKVRLTQGDIRQVQLAKAAILAGVHILTKEMGIRTEDIQRIHLAGSFGNVLNRRNARMTGLIPPGVDLEKVKYAGNSAHIGAQMNLMRAETGELAREVVKRIKYIELSDRTDFTEEFTEAMMFEEGGLFG